MRAEIYKIENDSLKLITDKDEVITVSKKEIDFDYEVGDAIKVEEVDGKHIFSPYDNVDIEQPKKNRNKHHRAGLIIAFFLCIATVVSIVAAIFIPKINEERQRQETISLLDSCLVSGYKLLNPQSSYGMEDINTIKSSIFHEPSTNITITINNHILAEEDKDMYKMAISCYNEHKVEDYQEMVDKLQAYENKADQAICLYNVEKNTEITNSELESAKNNIIETIGLFTRLSNRYQEQINCYEKYKTEESDTKISELRIKKSENDAYLESAKQSTINGGGNGNTNIHCTTNTIGGYTYTNCY